MKPDERADMRSLDRRFDDIALRLRKMEARGDTIGDLEKQLVTLALTRINDVLGPAYEQIEGKAHLGALLATTAEQELELPFAGQASFLVAIADRNTFAPAGFLSFVSTAEPTAIMLGSFVSYDPDTGVLVANITNSTGPAGPHTNWAVAIAQPPEIGYSYSQAEVDALIAAAIGDLVNGAAIDLDTLGEAAARIIALETDKAPLASPQLATPQIINSGNAADWQQAIELVRGDGTGKRYRLDTLGDAANGVVNLAVVDVTTGDRLMEIGADGYVNAGAGFKANGLQIPSILGVYHETGATSVTRTGAGTSASKTFAAIPRLTPTSRLSATHRCQVIPGDTTSNFAAAYCYAIFYNGVAWDYSRVDIFGIVTQASQGNVNWLRGVWNWTEQWLPAHDNGANGWSLGVGTQVYTVNIDVTWSNFGLFAIQTDTGA